MDSAERRVGWIISKNFSFFNKSERIVLGIKMEKIIRFSDTMDSNIILEGDGMNELIER